MIDKKQLGSLEQTAGAAPYGAQQLTNAHCATCTCNSHATQGDLESYLTGSKEGASNYQGAAQMPMETRGRYAAVAYFLAKSMGDEYGDKLAEQVIKPYLTQLLSPTRGGKVSAGNAKPEYN
jgi:hypothetical protein